MLFAKCLFIFPQTHSNPQYLPPENFLGSEKFKKIRKIGVSFWDNCYWKVYVPPSEGVMPPVFRPCGQGVGRGTAGWTALRAPRGAARGTPPPSPARGTASSECCRPPGASRPLVTAETEHRQGACGSSVLFWGNIYCVSQRHSVELWGCEWINPEKNFLLVYWCFVCVFLPCLQHLVCGQCVCVGLLDFGGCGWIELMLNVLFLTQISNANKPRCHSKEGGDHVNRKKPRGGQKCLVCNPVKKIPGQH